ncbi:MAG: IS66 family transposase zinc-finger binding domain-containing protein [Cyanobacteria bacterium P01_A01_bin.68]
MYSVSECEAVLDHHPENCSCCGEKLSGEDINLLRHQIVDIPPIKPVVVEHRLSRFCKGM